MELARQALDDKRGQDLTVLDVRSCSTMTDFFILVTGTSSPHLNALADEVLFQLKQAGEQVFRRSGTADSEWIALDYVDVVIHIFSDNARNYYDLQSLWKDASIIQNEQPKEVS